MAMDFIQKEYICKEKLHSDNLTKPCVHPYFHVPYVETGYRHINQPWTFYIRSIFHPNMESLNVWTHIVGTLVMLSRLYEISIVFDLTDRITWPLVAAILTFVAMFCTSSLAHMFSHKSMEINCVMFMADFASIGLYGYGTILNHYYYSLDHSFSESLLQQNAFIFGFMLAALTCIFGSVSKAIIYDVTSKSRTAMIVTVVGCTYIFSNIPILHRMWNNERTDGLVHHTKQMLSMLSVSVVYSTKLPERLSPGMFDLIGNSHQIFHILLVLCTQSHIDGVIWDLKFRQTFVHLKHTPSLWNTFGIVSILVLIDILTIKFFYTTFKQRTVVKIGDSRGSETFDEHKS